MYSCDITHKSQSATEIKYSRYRKPVIISHKNAFTRKYLVLYHYPTFGEYLISIYFIADILRIFIFVFVPPLIGVHRGVVV